MGARGGEEITLVGSRCGPFRPALNLLEIQQLEQIPLISVKYLLLEGQEALETAAQPGEIKVVSEN